MKSKIIKTQFTLTPHASYSSDFDQLTCTLSYPVQEDKNGFNQGLLSADVQRYE